MEKFYDKNKVLTQYWNDGIINTPFGRNIEVDQSKALNYLIQSTTSDLFIRTALNINDKLQPVKSNVAFLLHDSIILDFSKEDKEILKELIEIFATTDLGKFRVNVSIGKTYGDMRRVELNG